MEKMGVACTLDSFSSSDAFVAVGDAPVAALPAQGGDCAGRVRETANHDTVKS